MLARQPGRLTEAIAQYQRALRLEPNSAEAHNNLANALAQQSGRRSEAIAEYREALRLRPGYAQAHYNLANALSDQPGGLGEAIAEYEEALRLKSDFTAAHNNLALALAQSGRTAEAILHLQRALQIDPNLVNARQNSEKLRASAAGGN